jgi:hypothetical protein
MEEKTWKFPWNSNDKWQESSDNKVKRFRWTLCLRAEPPITPPAKQSVLHR